MWTSNVLSLLSRVEVSHMIVGLIQDMGIDRVTQIRQIKSYCLKHNLPAPSLYVRSRNVHLRRGDRLIEAKKKKP